MTSRIGVVADTHCPEFADRLPPRLAEVLAGVDLILHAGDINQASTLSELELIAPVAAVRGDHDSALASLPRSREVTVGGKKIVVVHGDRTRWVEEPETLLWTLSLGYFHPHAGLARSLRRRFPTADVIVFGHTHRPHAEVIDGTLLFNPGGVHQWNPATTERRLGQHPGWFEWCWLQVARHIKRFPEPSVGILEIGDEGVAPKIVPL